MPDDSGKPNSNNKRNSGQPGRGKGPLTRQQRTLSRLLGNTVQQLALPHLPPANESGDRDEDGSEPTDQLQNSTSKEKDMSKNDKGAEHFVHVFVYGSLKKHLGNHGYLRNAEFVGYDTISGPFTMVSCGGFPAVCTDSSVDGAVPVFGQLFKILPDDLPALDALEGHPRWYKREKLCTDYNNTRAWMYIQPESEIGKREAVRDNMWRCADDEAEHWNAVEGEPNFDVVVEAGKRG
jgi:gamma-glutamylcyclotransferase (GGCT)/AIG2-like uncharacterized protein YtfP